MWYGITFKDYYHQILGNSHYYIHALVHIFFTTPFDVCFCFDWNLVGFCFDWTLVEFCFAYAAIAFFLLILFPFILIKFFPL